MYIEFFQLTEPPFSITPDPAYLYLSPRHQEALGHLLYGTGQYGGFVQLTGEVGTGKTMVVRALLEQQLDGVQVAMVHNPRQSEREFVQTICDELEVAYDPDKAQSLKYLIDILNRHLLGNHARGMRTVLIIDEAQNLSPGVLEQVRLLTNLETHKEKLLRIMLVGQPELNEVLNRPDLRQLASRITARYHLVPLQPDETAEYIRHRVRVAGGREALFLSDAILEIHKQTHGIPRLINTVCDRCLMAAYVRGDSNVTSRVVRSAAAEVRGSDPQMSRFRNRKKGFLGFGGGGDSSPPFFSSASSDFPRLSLSWLEGILIGLAFMILGALIYQSVAYYQLDVPEPLAEIANVLPRSIPSSEKTAKPVSTTQRPEKSAAVLPVFTQGPPINPPHPEAMKKLRESEWDLAQLTGQLINHWDDRIRIKKGRNVCRELRKEGLECYRTNGGLRDLREMDRPVILTLSTEGSGSAKFALITQLSDDRARVETSSGAFDADLSQILDLWTGDMFLLWRRETKLVQLSPGSRGPDILWLRRRVAELLGKPADYNDRYDNELKDDIRMFQKARGLDADGIVGIRTRIALSDPAPGTPTLDFEPLSR